MGWRVVWSVEGVDPRKVLGILGIGLVILPSIPSIPSTPHSIKIYYITYFKVIITKRYASEMMY